MDMRKYISFLVIPFVFCAHARADFSTNARSAYLIDMQSGAEIVDKAAGELMAPSSMLKLMTLAVTFDALKNGELTMDQQLTVSENADYKNPTWAPASKICLVRGQRVSVSDLIMGLIVMSGGDAGVVVAEHLSGSESAFTQRMQDMARKIGMPQSTFGNVSGLPNPNNLMTSRELGTLAQYIINEYPEYYPLFASKRFHFDKYESEWCADWGRTHTVNYNKLLFIMPNADGLKTGHTDDGGYGMVASAVSGGRRLVGVINGLNAKNHDALAREMKKLLDYGFTNTRNHVFYNAGANIIEIPVWYGRKPAVVATVDKPFAVTLPAKTDTSSLRVIARYNAPARAPIAAGDTLGEIIAELDGRAIARAPLIASEKVGKVQFISRIIRNIKYIFGAN